MFLKCCCYLLFKKFLNYQSLDILFWHVSKLINNFVLTSVFHFKIIFVNAEDMAEYWLLFQKILHQIPVPTWRLTAFWNSCSKGSDFSSILCGHSMHKVHRHTCRLNSHTHKTKIKKHLWNKLPLWDHNVFIFLKLFYFIFQYPRFMLLIRCANTTLKLVTIWFYNILI